MSILEEIQKKIADRLRGLNALSRVDGIVQRLKSDDGHKIKERFNRGSLIVVLPPLPTAIKPNLPGPYFEEIGIQIDCREKPEANQGGPTALEMAEAILSGLHHFSIQLDDGQQVLILADATAPIIAVADESRLHYLSVNLVTSGGLSCQIF